MGEVISILSMVVDRTLLYWTPFICLFGYIVKHMTRIPNEFLPEIVIFISMAIATIYAGQVLPAWQSVVEYGIGQGLFLGIIACSLYDILHGAIKYLIKKFKKGEKRMEGKIKAFISKAFKAAAKSSLIVYALAYLSSLVVVLTSFWIVRGFNGLLDYWTEFSILGMYVCIFIDLFSKIFREREKLCWQYLLMSLDLCVVDAVFMWAYHSVTIPQMYIRLGIMGALVVLAVIIYFKLYKPAVAKIKELALIAVCEDIKKEGVSDLIAKKIATKIMGEE